MMIQTKSGVVIKNNDVIDIKQTVNGVRTFLVQIDENEPTAFYYSPGTDIHMQPYQYSIRELLNLDTWVDEDEEIEIVTEELI